MIGPPPKGLTEAEISRLEIVALPGPSDKEALAVYRFTDTLEYLAEDPDAAAAIQAAFPAARIRRFGMKTQKPATARSPRRAAPDRAGLDDRELEELARQYAKAAEPPPQSSKQHSTRPRQRS